MKLCGIYLLTHIETGRKYVGQSVDIKARWRKHKNTKETSHIGRAIRAYGFSAFEASIIEIVDKDLLNATEIGYITKLETLSPKGFNLLSGGGQNTNHHEDTKQKMSLAHKGVPKSAEHKAHIGDAHRGIPQSPEFIARRKAKHRKLSDESKAKMSASLTGKKHSEETRALLSAINKSRVISLETRVKMADSNRGQKRSGGALLNISLANTRRTPEEKEAQSKKRAATRLANKLLSYNTSASASGDLFS